MGVEVKSGGEGVIVADRGCNDGCCCETKGLIKEVKSELALQLERCCCDLKNG